MKRLAERASATKSKKPNCAPKVLDDEASARVLAEYVALEDVSARDIDKITKSSRGLSYREIAITFGISEVLGIPDAFALAPRFRAGFALQRAVRRALASRPNEHESGTASLASPAPKPLAATPVKRSRKDASKS